MNEETGPYDVTHIVRSRFFVMPASAVAAGLLIGGVRGWRMAGLRFLAENAHRPPTTIRGWYLYNKTKNYRRMAAGLKQGGVAGAKLGGTMAGWLCTEEAVDRLGSPWNEGKEVAAGAATAAMVASVSEWKHVCLSSALSTAQLEGRWDR